MEASVQAQRLALAAKHLGIEPFRIWHAGRKDLDELRPGNPELYRSLLYAMGEWLDEEDARRSTLGTMAMMFKPKAKGPPPRRRPE